MTMTRLNWLISPNLIRLVGGLFGTLQTLNGTLHGTHILDGVGDFLAGLGAAYILFRMPRPLTINRWMFILVWNCLGLYDILVAFVISTYFPFSDLPAWGILLPIAFLLIHLTVFIQLFREKARLSSSVA